MKSKFLLVVGLCLITHQGFAQISFDQHLFEDHRVDSNSFDRKYSVTLENNGSNKADTSFTWELTYIDLPNDWDYIIQFPDHCGHLKPITKGTFILRSQDSMNLNIYFTHFGSIGRGELNLKIASSLDTINSDSAIFRITTLRRASVKRTGPYKLDVYPNPSNDHIIVSGAANSTYSITNLVGLEIKKGKLTHEDNTIDMNDVPKGNYILNVKQPNSVVSKRISVIH